MNAKSIATAIITNNYSNDELNSIVEAIKFARSTLQKQKKFQFKIGDTVKFYNGRTGQTVCGDVAKIGIKNIKVKSGTTMWRVPAEMLDPAIGIGG
jgi:hypothetical protein